MLIPSECVLQRRVRTDGHADLADKNLRLFFLECKDRKAEGYADHEIEMYNERLQELKIGVRLAGAPPAVSFLAILGGQLFASIEAVDKTVIVISLEFADDGGRMSYLIYDAVALSLRMIPPPEDPTWIYTLSSRVSIVRPCQGAVYALVHTGLLAGVNEADSLYLWRPSSSSLGPWLDHKESISTHLLVNDTDTEFSFDGNAYWVDLLCGVSYCSCNALFDDNTSVAECGFTPLPVQEGGGDHRNSKRAAQPVAYRTMGVVCDSFIRFVSIDGFQQHVKLKNRTVTVWKLLGHGQDEPWELEHKISLKTLWEFEGFRGLPKDLTLMYPFLSRKDKDIVYMVLGECCENPYKNKFIPSNARYLLAVNMRKKIVTSVRLAHSFPDPFISCDISRRLRIALVGPCGDEGNSIPMMTDPMKKYVRKKGVATSSSWQTS